MSTRQMGASPAAPPKQRMEWMDTLRGFSITLVVIYHAFVFTYDDPASAPAWLWAVNEAFDPLRMPLMVFLSGMLIPSSLAKGTSRYMKGKLRNVAYPYVIWSLVMVVILTGAGALIGESFDATLVARVFYDPLEHMWFLAFLLIYYVVAAVTRRVDPAIVAGVAYAVSFVPAGDMASRLFLLLGFFMLGVASVRRVQVWARVLSSRLALIVAGGAFLVLFALSWQLIEVRYVPAFAALVLACAVGACVVARMVGAPKWLGWARYLGRESLVFYVIHYPVILVSLVVLRKALPGAPDIAFFGVAAMLALITGFTLAWASSSVPGMSWLFRFGGARPRRHVIGS